MKNNHEMMVFMSVIILAALLGIFLAQMQSPNDLRTFHSFQDASRDLMNDFAIDLEAEYQVEVSLLNDRIAELEAQLKEEQSKIEIDDLPNIVYKGEKHIIVQELESENQVLRVLAPNTSFNRKMYSEKIDYLTNTSEKNIIPERMAINGYFDSWSTEVEKDDRKVQIVLYDKSENSVISEQSDIVPKRESILIRYLLKFENDEVTIASVYGDAGFAGAEISKVNIKTKESEDLFRYRYAHPAGQFIQVGEKAMYQKWSFKGDSRGLPENIRVGMVDSTFDKNTGYEVNSFINDEFLYSSPNYLEIDALSEENLRDYQNGIHFTDGDQKIYLEWPKP